LIYHQKKITLPGNFQKISTTKNPPDTETTQLPPVDTEGIVVGMEVIHDRFGKGKVISVDGTGPSKKATVFFPVAGQKQLLLRFARLRPAE
jgi:DNA helicase-2/ATP-dependent DNA helicase PcrA